MLDDPGSGSPSRPPAGRRTARKRACRAALVSAAHELFDRYGFEATTVEAITARAGTSRRTFFRYFPSKESVLFDGQARRLETFDALLAPVHASETFAERLSRAVSAMVEVYEHDRDEVLRVQRILAGSAPLVGVEVGLDVAWERVVVRALRRGPDRRSPQAAALDAGIVVGGLRAAIRAFVESGGRSRLDVLAAQTLTRLAPLWVAPAHEPGARPKRRRSP